MSGCAPCARGMFGVNAGASACETCASGLFSSEEGRTSCAACPIGSACDGMSVPVECAAGRFGAGGASECAPCGDDDRYLDAIASDCSKCAAGSFTSGGTNTTRTACEPCPAGYSCDGTSVQTACAAGTHAEGGACDDLTLLPEVSAEAIVATLSTRYEAEDMYTR